MIKHGLLTTLILIFFLGSDIFGQTIDRGPYLQSVTTGSIFIKWRTDTATDSKVWWGSSPTNLNNTVTSGNNTTEHELQITGLLANTTYYYAVGNSSGQMAGADFDHYFNTAPLTSTTQTIRAWVLGDAGTYNDNQRAVRDAFYNYIGNNHIDVMLLLGDNAYEDGTDAEYQLAWFENMYEERLINSVMWSCFGNHDGQSADSDTETGPYYDIFTFPRNGEAGGEPSGTEAYYSFDYGNIHFISLDSYDSDLDVSGPMMTWLQDDLAGTSQDWIVVIFHHPPYTGNNGNSSDTNPTESAMRENFNSVLENAGVDLVLSGHHHSYQRSYLINGHYDVSSTWDPNSMGLDLGDGRTDGDEAYYKETGGTGTVYLVSGSAGDVASDPAGYPAMYAGIRELGSVSLEVTDLQMDVKFIDDNENILDYFTIIKQINPPTCSITSPMDGFYYANTQTITINATASDNSGTPSVEFFVNGTSIGTDVSPPYSKNYTFPSTGAFEIKAKATDGDGNVAVSLISVYVGDGSVCEKVNRSGNDAEEDDSGSVNRTSSDLEMVYDGNNQTIGIRFENLNIPQGAVINDAYIQFTSKNDNNENPRKLDIYGEDSDFPYMFGTINNNISSRTKTTAKVSWYPDFWTSGNESGPDQKTVQIRSIIQEIVNRSGFSMDSPIAIIIEGVGKRVAKSFDGNASDAPELCITFKNCPDSDGDGTCDADDTCAGPEPNDPCDDSDAGTYNDMIDSNCNCVGTPYDCYPDPYDIGEPCDDNDAGTYNDVIDSNCNCTGTPYDCYPDPIDIGDPCDDNDAGTYNDVIDSNCNCTGTPYDCYPDPMDIGDPCDDNDAGTYNDVIDSNCNCTGTPYDCYPDPLNIGDPCDDSDPNTNNDEVDSNCDCAGIPSGTGTLTSTFISNGSDDAEEDQNGNTNNSSSDLEMIIEGTDTQIIGLRFTGLNIPQGMYIMSAMIQFNADQTDNQNPCTLEIYGEDTDNASTFSQSNNNISSRTKTTAKVDWSPDDWTGTNDRGLAQRTVNIAPVIQEIVNRPGYTASSAISIIIEGTGKRTADSYEGGATKAPEITIIYDLTGPLPIELLDIYAHTQQDGIRINWSTASETNNDYFTIERSTDGRNFNEIGTIPGKGTTTVINRYNFLDKNPEIGLNYYRIKQTDFDGQFSYSRVVNAKFESDGHIQVFPSIVKDVMTVQRSGEYSKADSKIIIQDITGRSFILSTIEEGETNTEISVEKLIPGVYFVSIYNNEKVDTFKIVKL